MRSEIEEFLAQRRKMPNPTKPEPRGPLLRRQSHKQMKRLIDAIVETGLVHVQDGAGPFNSIISREGKNGVMADVLKATPELQAVFLKWWENLKEDNPPSSSETPRSSGITKDVYMWVLTRILSFLLTNTEESVTPAQGEREPWMNNDLARIRNVAEIDWNYDAHGHHCVTWTALVDMLYDLSSLWCDVGTTHNVAERSEFLEALYQRVFFVRLPAWTPLSVQNKVTRHLEGFEGSFEEVVVGGSPTKVPSKPGFGGTQSSATSPSAERPLRRYEQILNSIQYNDPASCDHHNLYPSFPYRKLVYPQPIKILKPEDFEVSPLAPEPPVPKTRLPSYSKTLAAVNPKGANAASPRGSFNLNRTPTSARASSHSRWVNPHLDKTPQSARTPGRLPQAPHSFPT
uniref:Uncharacterized protein n=1 Tax=Eutreptiella gymnastica TaxID=73025 RepID=A0A7S4FG52_9EUGL